MKLYAITDRRSLAPDEPKRAERLVTLAGEWARGPLDFIQIREKDLPPQQLFELATRLVAAVRSSGSSTRVLLNGRADLAIQAEADGVHIPGNYFSGKLDQVRRLWHESGHADDPFISVACHSVDDVTQARTDGANLAIFAPVFAKPLESGEMLAGTGLSPLAAACRAAKNLPVFALGGVTADNARYCLAAGATGVAGIRLFCVSDWPRLL